MPCFGDWCMGGWGRVDGVSGIGMEDLRGRCWMKMGILGRVVVWDMISIDLRRGLFLL